MWLAIDGELSKILGCLSSLIRGWNVGVVVGSAAARVLKVVDFVVAVGYGSENEWSRGGEDGFLENHR